MKKIFASVALAFLPIIGIANDDITEADVVKMWPINEDTHIIPKFYDRIFTGRVVGVNEAEIDRANLKYDAEDRRQVIDTCRMEAFQKRTNLKQKAVFTKRLQSPVDGFRWNLQEAFARCTSAMLRQWRETDAKEERPSSFRDRLAAQRKKSAITD